MWAVSPLPNSLSETVCVLFLQRFHSRVTSSSFFPSVSPGTLRTYDKFSFCNRDVTRLCHGPGGGTGSVMHMHAHMPENSRRNCKYKADWCFPLSGEYCAMNRQTRTANTRRHTHTHSCERETRFDVTWLLGNRSPWSWRFSIAANTAWKCVWLCSQYKRRFFVRDYSWFTLGRRHTITSSSTGGLADYSRLLNSLLFLPPQKAAQQYCSFLGSSELICVAIKLMWLTHFITGVLLLPY